MSCIKRTDVSRETFASDQRERSSAYKKSGGPRPAACMRFRMSPRYIVRSRCFCVVVLAASESSATSTEMLCLMGFQLHFFTSATSAMGM